MKKIKLEYCTVSERYWKRGEVVEVNNGQARLSGCWFTIRPEWKFQELN